MSNLQDMNTADEAAEYLRLTPDKLKRMARSKQIGHIRVGRDYIFPRDAIELWKTNNTVEPLPTTNPWGISDSSLRRLRQS
ncbi:helix-turn-helix domain-containing protein [Curtobacterium sp. MCSS17_015]|uniref:helix-turn-helix domain-containing protein n=1 Tax=Curtobacterium sp. MCSS17_015 TaxID=2175666 RepID=UPI0015E89D34|nr:helix-turn-helix domain-containing protein [Curtobacterium sp. MCSS17_015]WIB25860.1 helix-turn-helix domain-containing protein [Curtobacterium sp. MCSS17_015]